MYIPIITFTGFLVLMVFSQVSSKPTPETSQNGNELTPAVVEFSPFGRVDRIGIVLPAGSSTTPSPRKINKSSSSSSDSSSSSEEKKVIKRDVAENYGDEAEDSDPEWDDPNTAREVELSIEDQDIASTDGLF